MKVKICKVRTKDYYPCHECICSILLICVSMSKAVHCIHRYSSYPLLVVVVFTSVNSCFVRGLNFSHEHPKCFALEKISSMYVAMSIAQTE
jgi:hypothetical protein